jgi:putative alpha-1,2-mannosidase
LENLDELFSMHLPDEFLPILKTLHEKELSVVMFTETNLRIVAYLYNVAGQPWKTQSQIRKILKMQYKAKPDGLGGNDDCGQMSAWYIFSSLGFYPVSPGSDEYQIGSPSVKNAN